MQLILQRLKASFSDIPKLKLYLCTGGFIIGSIYISWCKWGPQPFKPRQIFAVVTSPKVASMERKAVQPKKLMVFTPKDEAVKKLQLPENQGANLQEEIFEATDAPPTMYGSTTVTFANISTGMPRSVITAKKAPWFQFERGNTAGGEYGIGSHGRYFQGDYQRDICSIKGVVLAVRGSLTSYPFETDWRAGVRAEYRW